MWRRLHTISANKCEKPQKQSSNFFPPSSQVCCDVDHKNGSLIFSGCWFLFFYVCFAFYDSSYIFFAQQCLCFCSFAFSSPLSRINDIKNYFYWDFPFVFLLPCHAKTKSTQKYKLYMCHFRRWLLLVAHLVSVLCSLFFRVRPKNREWENEHRNGEKKEEHLTLCDGGIFSSYLNNWHLKDTFATTSIQDLRAHRHPHHRWRNDDGASWKRRTQSTVLFFIELSFVWLCNQPASLSRVFFRLSIFVTTCYVELVVSICREWARNERENELKSRLKLGIIMCVRVCTMYTNNDYGRGNRNINFLAKLYLSSW